MSGDPLVRLGRADMHIHTLASDGVSSVGEILDRVEAEGFLDVIGMADHERASGCVVGDRVGLCRDPAARRWAGDRNNLISIVVGVGIRAVARIDHPGQPAMPIILIVGIAELSWRGVVVQLGHGLQSSMQVNRQ